MHTIYIQRITVQGHSARGIQRFNKVSDKRISGRDIWSAAVTVCQLVFPAIYCYNDSKIKKKKYLRFLFVLLICLFLGCNIQNNESVDEKDDDLTILADQSYIMQELNISRDSQQIYG